jgi:hypothetical protein
VLDGVATGLEMLGFERVVVGVHEKIGFAFPKIIILNVCPYIYLNNYLCTKII